MLEEQTFTELFLGELSVAQWKFQILLMTLGIFLRVFRKVSSRNDKEHRPSIVFWIRQSKNWAKFIYSIILMYILVRFFGDYEKVIRDFVPEKIQASIYLIMFGIGFFLHKISDLINSKLSKKIINNEN
ncbi:MAG: hypothetical protein ACJAVA_000375 [Flavobacteriaceae bacterium]|jgi:hypothetical protein